MREGKGVYVFSLTATTVEELQQIVSRYFSDIRFKQLNALPAKGQGMNFFGKKEKMHLTDEDEYGIISPVDELRLSNGEVA